MKKTWEVWNMLLEKPLEELSSIEAIVRRVNVFLVDFVNGSWLYNISPDSSHDPRDWSELRNTAHAVATIGAPLVARLLEDIAEIFETTNVADSGSWGVYLSKVDPSGRIEVLEQSVNEQIRGVHAALDEFTLQHFECESE